MGAGTFLFLPFFAPLNDDVSEPPEADTPGGAGNAPWAIAGKGFGGSARSLSGEVASSNEVASSARRAPALLDDAAGAANGARRAVDVDDDAVLDPVVPVLDAFSLLRREAPDTDGPTLHVLKLGSGEAGESAERFGDVDAEFVDGAFVVVVPLFGGSVFAVRVDDAEDAYPEPVEDARGRFA